MRNTLTKALGVCAPSSVDLAHTGINPVSSVNSPSEYALIPHKLATHDRERIKPTRRYGEFCRFNRGDRLLIETRVTAGAMPVNGCRETIAFYILLHDCIIYHAFIHIWTPHDPALPLYL